MMEHIGDIEKKKLANNEFSEFDHLEPGSHSLHLLSIVIGSNKYLWGVMKM